MLTAVFLLIAGLFLLLAGSELVVSRAQSLARKLDVSELVIGLTVLSFGSNLPEIATNLKAGFLIREGIDASGLALGNILGSSLAQITLVAGVASLWATLSIDRESLRREGAGVLAAFVLMLLAGIDGTITPIEGWFLCLAYVIYLVVLGRLLRRAVDSDRLPEVVKRTLHRLHIRAVHEEDVIEEQIKEHEQEHGQHRAILRDLGVLAVGLAMLILGADQMVLQGQWIATELGVHSLLIGLFLGLGTSLPELVIAVKSVSRGSDGFILGNLLGSNILDPLFALGAGAIVAPLTVGPRVLLFEFPFLLVGTVLTLMLLWEGRNITKREGVALISYYGLFVFLSLFTFA